MAREDAQLKVRLAEPLRMQVVEAAQQNNRSVNSEIVARLSGSFEERLQQEDISKLEEALQNLRKYVGLLEEDKRNTDVIAKQGRYLLWYLADAIRQSANGDSRKLQDLISKEQAEPMLSSFERPDAADDLDTGK